ncbi:MAG: antibiotic biosynthesis monooxygenase [Porticoccus sp.]|nr:antibiotic biosynthesis monooxygenase [Porticoccus sp.]
MHQDNETPAHFLFYENWESRELWQQHIITQHFLDYVTATEGAIKGGYNAPDDKDYLAIEA